MDPWCWFSGVEVHYDVMKACFVLCLPGSQSVFGDAEILGVGLPRLKTRGAAAGGRCRLVKSAMKGINKGLDRTG
jgi:hypothetical protein